MQFNPFKIVYSIVSILLVVSAPSYAMKKTGSRASSGQKAQVVITTARYRNQQQQQQQNIQSNRSYVHSRNIVQRQDKGQVESKSGAFQHNVIIELKPIKQEVGQIPQPEAMIDCAQLTDIGLAFHEDAQKNLDYEKMVEESFKAFEDEQKIMEAAQCAAKEYQARQEEKRAEIAVLKALGFVFPEDV